ncbi:hypothetical protein Goari_017332 [Gossypium aridum]|uniref:Uncharacterized protein n=1 Tax=Gossypium aridum TaxID=34290 RepID=A0A7J8WL96_GOSAI|nr:hypothetical protein [Gossypium aridum]
MPSFERVMKWKSPVMKKVLGVHGIMLSLSNIVATTSTWWNIRPRGKKMECLSGQKQKLNISDRVHLNFRRLQVFVYVK